MIKLTRLNGDQFILNAIYVEQIQSVPDTTITLTNGKKYMVREPEEQVIKLVTDYYRNISILASPMKDREET